MSCFICKECGTIFGPCGGCPKCSSPNVTGINKEEMELIYNENYDNRQYQLPTKDTRT